MSPKASWSLEPAVLLGIGAAGWIYVRRWRSVRAEHGARGAAWSWHIPGLYDAALRHPALHVLEHVVYMTAGGLYWWHLLSPIRSRLRLAGMGPALYMASTKLLIGLLGITLAFAPGTLFAF